MSLAAGRGRQLRLLLLPVVMPAHGWPWAALLLLGAVHGLNPGMGWLFAVALGLQERSRKAVWGALLPLAAGHALAIALAVGIAAAVGLVLPLGGIKWLVAATLLLLGIVRLRRHRHPRGMGMRVSHRDLTIWSFLMATAHGAGLMALPFVLAMEPGAGMDGMHHGTHGTTLATGLLATALHSVGYLVVLALMAALVYERLGLRILRSAWINLDLIWAGALACTAVLTVVV